MANPRGDYLSLESIAKAHVGSNPQTGYALLENYPSTTVREIVDDCRVFIFDFEENRVKKLPTENLPVALNYEKEFESKDNRIRVNIFWPPSPWGEWTETPIRHMHIETTSSVMEVNFDAENRRLSIKVYGESGTPGTLDLVVPKAWASHPVEAYLDNQPINFEIKEPQWEDILVSGRAMPIEYPEDFFKFHAEYTHSLHTLTVSFGAPPVWYEQPLIIAAIGGAIVVVIIALLLVRRRLAR